MDALIFFVAILLLITERILTMNQLDTKIAALTAAVARLVADFEATKGELAKARADLTTAQANAFSQAQLDAIQAVTDSVSAADPAPPTA